MYGLSAGVADFSGGAPLLVGKALIAGSPIGNQAPADFSPAS